MSDWGTTERGYGIAARDYSDYNDTAPRTIQVQESSLATESKLWVGPNSEIIAPRAGHPYRSSRMHLGIEEVRWLRDRLTEWLGDAPDKVQDMIDEGQR